MHPISERMANCFHLWAGHLDFPNFRSRPRAPHIGRLPRSRSERDSERHSLLRSPRSSLPSSTTSSPTTSPPPKQRIKPSADKETSSQKRSSCNQPRRRFIRVVRNEASVGEEYDNPHVVRRYTKTYWESLVKSHSEDCTNHPPPYEIPCNTILKRHYSHDDHCTTRHPQFNDDVKVIEFDRKEKIEKRIIFIREEKLHSDDSMTSDDDKSCDSITTDMENMKLSDETKNTRTDTQVKDSESKTSPIHNSPNPALQTTSSSNNVSIKDSRTEIIMDQTVASRIMELHYSSNTK